MSRLVTLPVLVISAGSLFSCSSGDVSPDPLNENADHNPHVDGVGGTYVPTDPSDPNNPNNPNTQNPSGAGGTTSTDDGETVYETVCTPVCSDEPPPDQAPTCAEWKEWGTCGQEWFEGYCQASCGTCDGEEEVCEQVPVSGGTGGSSNTVKPTNPGQTADPLPGNAQDGWASRYWDCCKPHCAWPGKGPDAMNMCTLSNAPLHNANAGSGCEGGEAFTCWNMAPWAVSETLAYGYAATPAGGNDCGKCYQLEFTGTGHHNASDPGSVSLAGKTMIVQSTNIGGDVGSGQFDILLPGGGVGAFNGCSLQWGTDDLGATYGGFLTECNRDVNCLRNFCENVFSGKPDLLNGCLFHVEWMKGADNPNLRYAEVECPAELEQISGMSL